MTTSLACLVHTYPLEFLLYMTWSMTVVYYKVNYLPVGVRIWFWPNCRVRVFGDRVKMAKNGLKMVEIFWGASHMIKNTVFNIFCFSTFSLGYFTNPVFWPNLEKIALKTRSRKYPKEKVEKQKMLKMVFFIICEDHQKISTIFKPFLAIFTLFHLKNWPYLQNPNSAIWPKPDSDSYR